MYSPKDYSVIPVISSTVQRIYTVITVILRGFPHVPMDYSIIQKVSASVKIVLHSISPFPSVIHWQFYIVIRFEFLPCTL